MLDEFLNLGTPKTNLKTVDHSPQDHGFYLWWGER